jgi:hypothetical protein
MTQAQLVTLEKDYIMVESKIKNTQYAVCRNGKGMYVISGDIILPIAAGNVIDFLAECYEVWKAYGEKKG